ncbi:hypothetical protein M407DRAFT_10337 [Tulasnella calospora MUT 4182]|uniref:BTB domain-containing protein n=1 Tax=Tulasnella calospora MUT 4182 TaxID=1051891 RepID=A0A0C3Q0J8_9AGAM|nr:hypothetical protein M407DRAFT_10337 [Tulasnella calospora MUT 4182]
MANADDAGAESVTFLVDEASFHGRRVIGKLASFQSGPALVVHNTSVFTDDDFERLGNIGQGGKVGRVNSIGRFGPGALSFYHFSELPWVISGEWCLFLDPSKQYLPRERGNIGRVAARVPLSFCLNRYPDQLKPLEGLFGFSSEVDCYKGTLFRFPLRTVDQTNESNLSKTHFSPVDITKTIDRFYAYATQSLFFTKSLREITALRRLGTKDLRTIPVWSAGSRPKPIPHGIDAVNLSLKLKPPQSFDETTEHWIVTRNELAQEEFPPEMQAIFPLHRLSTPTFGLAMNLSTQSSICNSRFFATLPLPVCTSLPVHIHATWILAQDRLSIRYDASNGAAQQSDDTLYNKYLLEKGVAPLYVRTLALILQHHPDVVWRFWPRKAEDDLSRIVVMELYELIISTQEPVLLSAQDKRIAPANSVIHSSKAPVGYLVKEGGSLDCIPLLVRGDRQLVELRSSGSRMIFASHRTDLARLFGPSTIVSLDFSDLAAQELVKLNVNVRTLDSRGMRELLARHGLPVTPVETMANCGTQRDWHKDVLEFIASPDCPVKVQDLADLPLLPAAGRDLVVSLNHAKSGKIWWRYPYEAQALTTVLLQLGVIAVDDLPRETERPDTNDLTRIIQLFGQLNLSSGEVLQRVAPKDWDAFVQYLKPWIQDDYLEGLSGADLQTLETVPFFRGRQGIKQLSYVPTSQVMMLPDSVPLDIFTRYLPPETTFAESSPQLVAVLRVGNHAEKILSFPSLFSQLHIPGQLTENEDDSFSSLLLIVATHHTGTYDSRLIPDGTRTLRRPGELFDHRVTLFSTAFEGRDDLFVHPNFRHLIDSLIGIGVRREITSQILLECIQAVDRDARQGLETGLRAGWIWDYVNTAPPQLREITFATVPTPHLTAVYPSIGEPSPADVVRHLSSLVNRVAPERDRSSTLLSDIRSVYDWLGSNRDDVRALLQPLANEPLWLNINSDLDDWVWRAADQLVFDLTFDVGGRFVVQTFLLPHRSLLVDAGANEYRLASPPPSTTSEDETPHWEGVRSGWNQLRETGQLLDICFKVEGQEIPAHRGMLAVVVPYFRDAFVGSSRKSIIVAEGAELPVYPLPQDEAATAFTVQSVVELWNKISGRETEQLLYLRMRCLHTIAEPVLIFWFFDPICVRWLKLRENFSPDLREAAGLLTARRRVNTPPPLPDRSNTSVKIKSDVPEGDHQKAIRSF